MAGALGCGLAFGSAAFACDAVIAPVITLDHGSRYQVEDSSRSAIDAASNRAVTEALKPVDDFIRALSRDVTAAIRSNDLGRAECGIAAIATWAEADALSRLDSFNARLAVGGRLAGIVTAYGHLRPLVSATPQTDAIDAWLSRRTAAQIDFWEKDATTGARRGNLRAWASLAILLTGQITDDDAARFWAYASAARILCSTRPDGSLPQETRRGKFGLHYQFHAIAPLVTIAASAQREGMPLSGMCHDALSRAVTFALTDYRNRGAATEDYAGAVQSYFDGTQTLEAHVLAWIPAYLTLHRDPLVLDVANDYPELLNSKLGGDQWLLWPDPR
ncbi:alginate lyase family protein [Jannaschia sp. 2305UL9-9]|uniref:alginate lyase family protein n=1 Tax=Jannaschia sp. 2305UL9-9 TaxID=3121638 RepID=UPI003528A13B